MIPFKGRLQVKHSFHFRDAKQQLGLLVQNHLSHIEHTLVDIWYIINMVQASQIVLPIWGPGN